MRAQRPWIVWLARLGGGAAILPALLVLVRAPTHGLWLLRIGLTEWGHYALPFVVGATTTILGGSGSNLWIAIMAAMPTTAPPVRVKPNLPSAI